MRVRVSTVSPYWLETKDGDPAGLALYQRHYSRHVYRDGRNSKLFCGPGYKLVLISLRLDALLVWRKFRSMDKQDGISCAIFRNESDTLSSLMLKDGMDLAFARFPDDFRLYTYVNPQKVKSANPGYCFKVCGWRKCGESSKGLHILEYLRNESWTVGDSSAVSGAG